MANSVKIVLRIDKKDSRGESPLYLRIIVNRKAKFFSLGYSIRQADWCAVTLRVKKTNPYHYRLNALISKKIAEAESLFIESEVLFKTVSLNYVAEKLKGNTFLNFFDYAEEQLKIEKSRLRYSTVIQVETALKKLLKYHGSRDLRLTQITAPFLEKYEIFLRNSENNSSNTIHNNMKWIKRYILKAVNNNLISSDKNPFANFKIKKSEPIRVVLSELEIQKIENLKLTGRLNDARNFFLFSYYSAGLRSYDNFNIKFKNLLSDGRIRIKTHKTGKTVTIRLGVKALKIIDYYKQAESLPENFIFPFLDNTKDYSSERVLYKAIAAKTSLVNKYLAKISTLSGINKKITCHVARHTFATVCLIKGIPLKQVSLLMGHNDLRTTEVYTHLSDLYLEESMKRFNE